MTLLGTTVPFEKKKIISAQVDLSNLLEFFPSLTSQQISRDELASIISDKFAGISNEFNVSFSESFVNLLWQIPEPDPQGEQYNKDALRLAKQKRFDDAITLWRKALEIDLTEPDFHYNLGLAFFELKNYKNGLDRLHECVRVCPIYHRAYFILGSIYSKMRNFEKAENYIRLGLMFKPDNISALINLGAVLSIQKKSDQAILIFERAISLNPKEPRAYLGLGKIYYYNSDIENASRCLQLVLKLDPDGILGNLAKQTLKNISLQNLSHQAPSSSREDRATIIPDSKNDSMSLHAMGYQAFLEGNYSKAAENYKRYLEIETHDAEIWALLASCQLKTGQLNMAVESIKKALIIKPNKAALLKQAAIIFDASEMYSESGQAARKAFDLGKQDSIVISLIAKSQIFLGQLEESLKYFDEAIRLNPNNLFARFYMAQALKNLGRIENAKEHLEEILWSKSKSPIIKELVRQEIEKLT